MKPRGQIMQGNYVAVVGSLNCDLLFSQNRLPERGETFTANSVAICSGGKGANQAVQCSKLGVPVYLAGKVGTDFFGDYLLANMREYGVDTRHITQSDANSGIGSINVLPDGSVYATIAPGANYDFRKADVDSIHELITHCEILVLQLELPVETVEFILEAVEDAPVYVVLNAAPAKKISAKALSRVDCLVVNEVEASYYLGEAISDVESVRRHYHKLLAKVRESLIVTLGKQGSVLCNKQGVTVFEVDKTVPVVETTGAGDSYIGAYVSQKFVGKSDEESCAFANKIADFTVTQVGAQNAMPTKQQVLELLSNH